MEKTKLTAFLKSFSGKEFRDFGKFVNSPFHNESMLLGRLYDCLKDHHPDYENSSLTKKIVFDQIYPGQAYNDKKLRDRFSDLLELAEEFLVINNILKDPKELKKQKLNLFANRKLDIQFDHTYRDLQELLNSSKIRNEDYFLELYKMVSIHREYYEFRKAIGKRIEFFKEGEKEVDHFILYFIVKMLKYYITMQNQERHIKHKYKYSFLEPVMKYIEENNFDEHPVIKIFYYLIKLRLDNNNEELFHVLKSLTYEYLSALERNDQIILLAELYNYSHFKFVEGKKNYRWDQFEIIKLMLKYTAYPQNNGYMTELHFINCVSVPLSISEIPWVERFLEENKNILPQGNQYNAYYIGQCFLLAEKKDYDSALRVLSKVSGDDFFYHLHLKNQYCKIYFELKEYEMVLNVLDSFRNYLSSNQMIPDHFKNPFGNFISVLKKITLAVLNDDDFMISKLDKEISTFPKGTLMNTEWLKQITERMAK